MTATGMKATHGRQVERVLWIVLLLNMAVAAAKQSITAKYSPMRGASIRVSF